jgi:sulfur carrier protein
MTIIWNGAARDVESRSLVAILRELGYDETAIATAVNGEFVPARKRETVVLDDGDALEVVAPRQGG